MKPSEVDILSEFNLMDKLNATEKDGYVEIEVIAHPKGNRNAITGIHDGALKISVTSAPEDGKANDAIIKVLSDILGVSKGSVKLVSGMKSRRKRFQIDGVSIERIRELEGEIDR